MKIQLILSIWASSSLAFSQTVNDTIRIDNQSFVAQFETTGGRLNGAYKSYYSNGQLRVEGNFENNIRTGVWSVWDSTGVLHLKRNYENPFSQKQLYPPYPNDPTIQLLGGAFFEVKRDSVNLLQYPFVRERAIINSSRLWRFIPAGHNPLITGNGLLEQHIYQAAKNHAIRLYKNDQFSDTLSWNKIDTAHQKLIGFTIKEDWFAENERLVSEYRIIGISAVVENIITGKVSELCWVYFPELRFSIANVSMTDVELPAKITTLDDLFFYRYFYGVVIKKSSLFNQVVNFSDLKNIQPNYQPDLELIEQEHTLWLSYTGLQ